MITLSNSIIESLKQQAKLAKKQHVTVFDSRRKYDEYSDCKTCRGTLYDEDGNRCDCYYDKLKSLFQQYIGYGSKYYNVNLDFYEQYFPEARYSFQKGLSGEKKSRSSKFLTKFVSNYLKSFNNFTSDGSASLFIHGGCGTGKTGLSVYMLQQVAFVNYADTLNFSPQSKEFVKQTCYFSRALKLLDTIRASYGDNKLTNSVRNQINRMKYVKLLVIDDFLAGYTKSIDWAMAIFLDIIKERIELNLPTVITSNIDVETILSQFEESDNAKRLISLFEQDFIIIGIRSETDVRKLLNNKSIDSLLGE